jgi:hypothetical protein
MSENIPLSLEIVSKLPGRIRFRLPRRFETGIDPDTIKKQLLSLAGVTEVRINALARSLVVSFRVDKLTPDQVESYLQEIVRSLSPDTEISSPVVSEELSLSERSEIVSPDIEISSPVIPEEIFPPERLKIATISVKEEDSLPIPVSETVVFPVVEAIREAENTAKPDPLEILCREQAEAIEQLQEQCLELSYLARIGQHYLRKGSNYSPRGNESEINTFFLAVSPEKIDRVSDWTTLARQQTETIQLLREQIADLRRLAAIGEYRLHRWRR